jgi:hypothetical protein
MFDFPQFFLLNIQLNTIYCLKDVLSELRSPLRYVLANIFDINTVNWKEIMFQMLLLWDLKISKWKKFGNEKDNKIFLGRRVLSGSGGKGKTNLILILA